MQLLKTLQNFDFAYGNFHVIFVRLTFLENLYLMTTLLSGRYWQCFCIATTCLSQPCFSGPRSGCYIQVWLYPFFFFWFVLTIYTFFSLAIYTSFYIFFYHRTFVYTNHSIEIWTDIFPPCHVEFLFSINTPIFKNLMHLFLDIYSTSICFILIFYFDLFCLFKNDFCFISCSS